MILTLIRKLELKENSFYFDPKMEDVQCVVAGARIICKKSKHLQL